jgi:hypothetical protein
MRRGRGRPLVSAELVWSDIDNRLANRKARASTSIGRSDEAIVETEDHGIPGADFSVVLADSVAEDGTKSIVVRSRRQPTNPPFASLGSPKLRFDLRVFLFVQFP